MERAGTPVASHAVYRESGHMDFIRAANWDDLEAVMDLP
jgi:hypothetical protein